MRLAYFLGLPAAFMLAALRFTAAQNTFPPDRILHNTHAYSVDDASQ